MENKSEQLASIGVIVARFQVHELHEGHHYVIDQVVSNHKKSIIFLGVSRFVGTKKNPLDFDTRKKMVQSHYPDSVIMALPDFGDNARWARELDKRIREVYQHGDVLLYGSRDSFIPYYQQGGGKFQTKELEPLGTFAGTDVRRLISEEVKNSVDFRSGVIYQSYNLYPKVLPTVDVAPLSEDGAKVLLGRKYDEDKFRFIGGFLTPSDDSNESAVKRVFHTEAGNGAEIGDIKYIGNTRIDDWRFRGEEDKIMTTFFSCKYLWGPIQPSEELGELKWFDIKSIKLDEVIKEHQVLLNMLRNEK